jgi:iron complex outermembrane receptor protein
MRKYGLINTTALACIAVATVHCAPAVAQDDRAAAEPKKPAIDDKLDGDTADIVVTATKRPALLREIPLPVQAITGEMLQKMGARSFSDYSRTVAGLQTVDTGTGRNQIFMRGIAAPQGYIGMQSAIGVYLDEVPISEGFSQPDLNLYDIERIEVLRGPQGTLYGSASMGGTIRLVSNKPDPTRVSGFVEGDLSATDHGGVNGAYTATLNLPIASDIAAIRGVFYGRNVSGFIDNPVLEKSDVNYENTYGGRVSLRVEATPNLTVDLSGSHQEIKQGGYNDVDSQDGTIRTRQQYRAVPEPFRDRSTIANATLHYHGSAVDVVSASSLNWRRRAVNDDYSALNTTGIPAPVASVQQFRTRSFTQELRLSSVRDGLVSWLIGGYYSNVRNDFDQTLSLAGLGALIGQADDTAAALSQNTRIEELAAFGEVAVHPIAPLTLTGGLRYDRITLDAASLRSGLLVGGTLQDQARQSQHVVIPKFNMSYKISARLLLYTQATKGYRIGGLNVTIAPTGDGFVFPRSYNPDSIWNYEIGFKGTALNRMLDFDIDGFIIDWKNIQLDLQHEGFDYFANAGNARSQGVEAQFALRPSVHISIGGQVTYTDSRLTTTSPGVGTKGDRVPFVPKLSASGYLEYHTIIRGIGRSFARVDVQQVGRSFSGFGTTDNFAFGNYAIANLRVGTTISGLEVALYARNVLDRRAALVANAYTAGSPGLNEHITVSRPRTIGFDVSKRF